MSDIESDESDLDAEHGDVSEECHNYLKRKKLMHHLPELINLSKLPNGPEWIKIKTGMKSKRLSTRIDKKVTEINNRFKSLDTALDQLKKLVNEKRTNTDEHIQATKDETSIKIGEFTKKRKEIESTFNTERDKYAEDTTRESTEIKEDIQKLKVILTAMEEQFDQTKRVTQEQEAAERSRIESEIENMKAKIAEEKDRHDREIENMKAKVAEEKDRQDREITKLNEEVKEYEFKIKKLADEEVLAKINLNKTLETLQTHLKKVTQEKEKIEGIIIKMNAIMNNKKKAMDDCIKASTERLINIKNNMKENFKLMDQIEEKNKREVDAEIQNLRNAENQIIEIIENNIQT